MTKTRRSGRVSIPKELVGSVYVVIATRRTAFDTLMWQVPALGLTAQAFLLTIAYGSDSSSWARYLSSLLAFVVAAVAIQTMRKHRANELTDSLMLEDIEKAGRITIDGAYPHARPVDRAAATHNTAFREFTVRNMQSFTLWVWSLRLFAFAAVVASFLTVVDPAQLNGADATAPPVERPGPSTSR